MSCSSCGGEGKVYVGDIGTEIVVDTCSDLSTATKVELRVEKPSGAPVTWAGTVFETTKIRHVAVSGDLDEVGEYNLQAYVEMPGWTGSREKVNG